MLVSYFLEYWLPILSACSVQYCTAFAAPRSLIYWSSVDLFCTSLQERCASVGVSRVRCKSLFHGAALNRETRRLRRHSFHRPHSLNDLPVRRKVNPIRVHLVNPSDNSFGTAVITPRWLFVLAAATPNTAGDPILVDETLEAIRPETMWASVSTRAMLCADMRQAGRRASGARWTARPFVVIPKD